MPYHHFTSVERDKLQLMDAQGHKADVIAQQLGKHSSSIHRELRRNRVPEGYISGRAQMMCSRRRLDTKPCPKKGDERLMADVLGRLKQDHAPQQIAGRLVKEYPKEPKRWVSAETIYTWVYSKIQVGEDLKKHLRQGKRSRRKRISGKEKRVTIKGRIPIDQRPAEVEDKQVCGHWEGDTVEGARKSGYVCTLVERKTKLLAAFPLAMKKADALAKGAKKALGRIPEALRKSLTLDNGTEFARHQDITAGLGINVYFARPYHSWERGLNEHTNGLLRQYFPKGIHLLNLTVKQLAKAVDRINNRPRKCLDYQTPAEAFAKELCALQI
jgi:IS30 family transposase